MPLGQSFNAEVAGAALGRAFHVGDCAPGRSAVGAGDDVDEVLLAPGPDLGAEAERDEVAGDLDRDGHQPLCPLSTSRRRMRRSTFSNVRPMVPLVSFLVKDGVGSDPAGDRPGGDRGIAIGGHGDRVRSLAQPGERAGGVLDVVLDHQRIEARLTR